MDFFRRSNFDLIGRTRIWFGLSLALITAGMITVGVRGLNYGIDFTGGSLLKYRFERSLSAAGLADAAVIAQVRSMLEQYGLSKSQIQVSGGDELYIRTAARGEQELSKQQEQIRAGLQQLFGATAGNVTNVGKDMVGPVVGQRMRSMALLSLIIGALGIMIYIAIRYEFRFGVAGIVGLVHDVLVVVSVMALTQAELNSEFIAAILTVIGYSINDSVIIFDRIRENMRLHRGGRFADIVNASLLQTMTRSINTTMTVVLTLVALFLFGGPAIHAFALAMMVGILTGAYSSIFTASPLVVLWERGEATVKQRRRRPAYVGAATRERGSALDQTPQKESEPEKRSSEEAIRQAKEEAQEEKREERRERRKRHGDKSSRRRF